MREKYADELNKIHASSAFKAGTKAWLLKEQQQPENDALAQLTPPKPKPFYLKPRYWALAACLALVVGLGVYALSLQRYGGAAPQATMAGGAGSYKAETATPQEPLLGSAAEDTAGGAEAETDQPQSMSRASAGSEAGELPKLPVLANEGVGMGFEGYLLYSFGELGINSVWSPDAAEQPTTLPAYVNKGKRNERMEIPEGQAYSNEQVRQLGEKTAAGLGVEITGTDETGAFRTFDGGSIAVAPDGAIHISLDEAGSLPAPTAPAATAPREEHEQYLQAMMARFAPLLSYMQTPTAALWMDRTFAGDANWHYEVYDAGANLEEALANRGINYATFYPDENGRFMGAWLHRKDLSGVVGSYPIITAEAALAQAVKGMGLTTAPTAFPGEEAVAGIELVYYSSIYNDYLMPYYKVYAQLSPEQLPDDRPDGLETYGVWYIPAVQAEYLDIAPEAQIYFN